MPNQPSFYGSIEVMKGLCVVLIGFPAEEKEVSQCVEDILFSVDQLALAFTDRFVSSFPLFTLAHFILWSGGP